MAKSDGNSVLPTAAQHNETRRAAKRKRRGGGSQQQMGSLFVDLAAARAEKRELNEAKNRERVLALVECCFAHTPWDLEARVFASSYCGLAEPVDEARMDETLLTYVRVCFARAVSVTRFSPRETLGQLAEWFETSLGLIDEFERREHIVDQAMKRFRRKAEHVDTWRGNTAVQSAALQLAWLYAGLATSIDEATVEPRVRDAIRFYFAQEVFRASERPTDTPGQQAEWFEAMYERARKQALEHRSTKA